MGESPNSSISGTSCPISSRVSALSHRPARTSSRRHSQPGAFNPTLNCLPHGVPHGDLLPEPFNILHFRGAIVMLYEVGTTFRQTSMDGRELPVAPSPTWQGYSVGRWEGDTLVVEPPGSTIWAGWMRAAPGTAPRCGSRSASAGAITATWS